MVSYAMICGIPAMTAVSIYSVEGLSGLGGRLLLGVLADRLGAKPVLIGGLLVQALAIGSYLVVNKLGQFYALSIVFGTAYGGVMPLYAVLAREYFGPRIMGTVFGAATMVSSLGMAFGPWAWRHDIRHFPRLSLALYRFPERRFRCDGGGAGLPATSPSVSRTAPAGLMPLTSAPRTHVRFPAPETGRWSRS